MTTWHWVRHGPTHEKGFVGWRDVPADLTNAALMARLDAHLPKDAVLVSSDLIRSVATADALARPERQRLGHEEGLRELNFGIWDGMHWKDIAERDPDLSRAYWATPGDIRAPDGESWNEAAHRVGAVVDRLSVDHPETHIIAVAHFGVILTQLQRALGASPKEVMAHKIDNLSVTTLVQVSGSWRAEGINRLV
ncbi:MAG: histidine phosphatase family protein [Sulfitobacter sp.]|nr:histidine phosphatase family protein [Sulfitobacter sp.]